MHNRLKNQQVHHPDSAAFLSIADVQSLCGHHFRFVLRSGGFFRYKNGSVAPEIFRFCGFRGQGQPWSAVTAAVFRSRDIGKSPLRTVSGFTQNRYFCAGRVGAKYLHQGIVRPGLFLYFCSVFLYVNSNK